MNTEEFDEVVNFRKRQISEILINKAKEYSVNGDRLHNFNVASRIMNQSREKCLIGFMMKHFVSIMDMVDNFEPNNPDTVPTKYLIEEKIGDAVNYLVLLEACFKDRIQSQVQLEKELKPTMKQFVP